MGPTELPPYEPPPEFVPLRERKGHPDYDNNLKAFLPTMVTIQRQQTTDALGFNIRGGAEYACGIYISKVLPSSEAERQGLKEGDQILAVNETSFVDIEHNQAVKVLKSNTNIHLVVRFFPYGYQKSYEQIPSTRPAPPIQQQTSETFPDSILSYSPQQVVSDESIVIDSRLDSPDSTNVSPLETQPLSTVQYPSDRPDSQMYQHQQELQGGFSAQYPDSHGHSYIRQAEDPMQNQELRGEYRNQDPVVDGGQEYPSQYPANERVHQYSPEESNRGNQYPGDLYAVQEQVQAELNPTQLSQNQPLQLYRDPQALQYTDDKQNNDGGFSNYARQQQIPQTGETYSGKYQHEGHYRASQQPYAGNMGRGRGDGFDPKEHQYTHAAPSTGFTREMYEAQRERNQDVNQQYSNYTYQ